MKQTAKATLTQKSPSRIPVKSNSTLSNKNIMSNNRKVMPPVIKKSSTMKRTTPSQSTSTNSSLSARSLPSKPSSSTTITKSLLPKKRALTGTNSVTQDLNDHQKNLNKVIAEVSHYQTMKSEVEQELFHKNNHLNEARAKIVQLQQEMKTKSETYEEEIKRIHDKFQRENNQLLNRYKNTKDVYTRYEEMAEQKREEIERILKTYEHETKERTSLMDKKREYEEAYANADALLMQKRQKIDQRKSAILKADNSLSAIAKELQQLSSTADQAEGVLLTNEEKRRMAHDRVQELKGNIRVFCRVKPRLNNESDSTSALVQKDEEYITFNFFGDDHEGLGFEEVTRSGLPKKHVFTYDRVFRPDETQEDCFEEISQLVQSALDGYNVSIFAYGQTGSGKTYTMQGPPKSRSLRHGSADIVHSDAGMIPRAVHQIYDIANKLKRLNWNYTITGEFLEIYNEAIHDLLGDPADYGKIKHDLMLDNDEKIRVTKLTAVDLHSPEQVQSMLNKAMKNRSMAATKLNLASSRSHCVFTLRITGENKETKETRLGVLNLIDLAGSESVSKSGSEGDRFREASNINKSLSSLGNVILALAKKSQHIPYRDSKLTYLLKDSFGGNCKTLMFVNVSQEKRHLRETLFSLRFATTVNSCKVPKAKQN